MLQYKHVFSQNRNFITNSYENCPFWANGFSFDKLNGHTKHNSDAYFINSNEQMLTAGIFDDANFNIATANMQNCYSKSGVDTINMAPESCLNPSTVGCVAKISYNNDGNVQVHAVAHKSAEFMIIKKNNFMYKSGTQYGFFKTVSNDNLYRTKQAELESGDIVLLYSDGVSDNLFADKIESVVRNCKDITKIAETVVTFAYTNANRSDSIIPYHLFTDKKVEFGGKSDCITAVVICIS